jgi:CDP-glucose 4,6-dehydratase
LTEVSYRSARILVTGATGFIGSHLVRALLDRGAELHVYALPTNEPESELVRSGDLERAQVHRGRLEDPRPLQQAVRDAAPEFVFHLGAQTLVGPAREEPEATFAANIAGTWILLEACRRLSKAPRAIVVASSDKAYGGKDHLPYVETDALNPGEPYEASKAATDMLARSYGIGYGLATRISRCGNVYGSGDIHWSRLLPGTIRSVLAQERPVLRSDGRYVRDYVHVDDVVAGYLALGTADVASGEPFNFASGEKLTVLEVVRLVAEAVGVDVDPVITNTAVGEIREQYLDSSKARTMLGWVPRRRMRESLPEIIEWYRARLGGSSVRPTS